MHRCLLLALALALPACAARTAIEPLGEGRTAFSASLGGPLVSAFDTYLPIPNVTVGAEHGLGERLDVGGTLHLLPLAYGLVGFDVGATYYPIVDSSGATIAVQPRLLTFVSVKPDVAERVRVYPALSASAAWRNGDDRVYTGFDFAVPVSSPDYDNDPPPVIFSPFVGYHWAISSSVSLLGELKWHGANVRTNATAEYVHPFGYGGIAPFIGVEVGR
jgi:hypothetical protein